MVNKPKATLLVVDDNPENVTLLSRILTDDGYLVKAEDNGTGAIDFARRSSPDLILLDVALPSMDGFETCAQLKKDKRTRDIPIVFISALDDIGNKVKAFQAGGVDYILKPFELEEVRARVETHLAMQQLRLQLESVNRELTTRLDELTRSQELLRERERKLSAFVSALPNLSFVYDEEGRSLEILANETSLLRARAEEMQGRLIREIMPPPVAEMMMDAIQQTIETGKVQIIEYKIPVLTGEEHWFEGRIALMEKNADGHSKVILIATEISERVRLYEEVQRLAMQDPLTNCYNRRHFMTLATQELQRALRYQRPLSLIMLDIDHFKKCNDQYGHQVGDRVLCSLVHLCQRNLRSVDILGRYGGEEFVILMPETGSRGAIRAAERLRDEIERMKTSTPDDKCSITVSVGVAGFEAGSEQAQTVDLLIKRADQALYKAKNSGRNCVRTS